MPTTPEARLSRRVRIALQEHGCAVERIENRVNLGVPDMLVGIGSRFVMLELKALTRGLAVALRPHQIAFLTRHSRAGRPCFVLVHDGGSVNRKASLSLYSGTQALELAEIGLRAAPIMSWPDREIDWPALVELLSAGIHRLENSNGPDPEDSAQ
jgi:hypothetical protein